MDAELKFHIEAFAEDLVRSGVERGEALRRGLIEFGGIENAKEECREARGVTFIDRLIQDSCFGLRMLRNSPGFAAVAVLTLAVGIGVTASVLTVCRATILQPLSVPVSGELVRCQDFNALSHCYTEAKQQFASDRFEILAESKKATSK